MSTTNVSQRTLWLVSVTKRFLIVAALTSPLFSMTSLAAESTAATNNVAAIKRSLLDTPMEDLLRTVTIVTRSPEPLERTPAAVSVLTADDIRRSGATSIPEALRLVPGMDVARVDSHTWAISSRGFNDV